MPGPARLGEGQGPPPAVEGEAQGGVRVGGDEVERVGEQRGVHLGGVHPDLHAHRGREQLGDVGVRGGDPLAQGVAALGDDDGAGQRVDQLGAALRPVDVALEGHDDAGVGHRAGGVERVEQGGGSDAGRAGRGRRGDEPGLRPAGHGGLREDEDDPRHRRSGPHGGRVRARARDRFDRPAHRVALRPSMRPAVAGRVRATARAMSRTARTVPRTEPETFDRPPARGR